MSEIRVLVLGALGMLGHRLVLALPELGYRVIGTARRGQMLTRGPGGLLELDAVDQQELFGVLDRTSPHAVVNCIGWVRQRSTADSYAEAVHVNAVFPHWLDQACSQRGTCQGGCKAAAQVCFGSLSAEEPFLRYNRVIANPL